MMYLDIFPVNVCWEGGYEGGDAADNKISGPFHSSVESRIMNSIHQLANEVAPK